MGVNNRNPSLSVKNLIDSFIDETGYTFQKYEIMLRRESVIGYLVWMDGPQVP